MHDRAGVRATRRTSRRSRLAHTLTVRVRMVGSIRMASVAPVDEDEVALVSRLRAGDETAYEYVVRNYGRRLLTLARRILGSEEDARDAVQDAFLNAFRSLDRFEGGSRFSTWLHRIA